MNAKKLACAPEDIDIHELWSKIDWNKCECFVQKLQARIVKAQREGKHNKDKALHRKMVAGTYGGNGLCLKTKAFIPLPRLGVKEKKKQKYLGTSFTKFKNSRTFVFEESFDIMQSAAIRRSCIVAKSLPTIICSSGISYLSIHYKLLSYSIQRSTKKVEVLMSIWQSQI